MHSRKILFSLLVISLFFHPACSFGQSAPAPPFRPGFRGLFESGWFGIGGGNYEEVKLGLALGYQLNPWFLTGLGSGLRIGMQDDRKLTYPLFAFLRVSSVEKKVSPYFSMGIGHFYGRDPGWVREGLFLSSTLGARLNLDRRHALYLGLGIEIQNQRWTSNNSAGLNLGLIF